MTIQELRDKNLIIFETIAGSKAYGTDLETSDTDIRGVFVLPQSDILGTKYIEQVNDTKNDIVFYEIKRILELLATNNPNILELLNSPKDCIIYKHPVFDLILKNKDKFITKNCRFSFGGYAIQQIKKARGKKKKIVNPVDKKRKTPLDFCYVIRDGHDSKVLTKWLKENNMKQEFCGLASVNNMKDIYALYYNHNAGYNQCFNYRGIISKDNSNDICVSSIPKYILREEIISYNKDGYIKHCKDYKEYWEWVENRNKDRFKDIEKHKKGYDGKNLMHCHRLLDVAKEIALGKGINVRRPNREYLLSIRKGKYEYNNIIQDAENKMNEIDELFEKSDLPTKVNRKFIHDLLVEIRNKII